MLVAAVSGKALVPMLTVSIGVMIVAYLLGTTVGLAIHHVMHRNLDFYIQNHPLPSMDLDGPSHVDENTNASEPATQEPSNADAQQPEPTQPTNDVDLTTETPAQRRRAA